MAYPRPQDFTFHDEETPPVEELSLLRATAMTSPHAATTEVVAAMATTEINDTSQPRKENQLPAVNAEHAAPKMEQEQKDETVLASIPTAEEEAGQPSGDEPAMNAPIQNQDISVPMEASIPDGANLIQDVQSGFPANDVEQMAMNTLYGLQMQGVQSMFFDQPLNLPPVTLDSLPTLPMAMNDSLSDPYLDPSPYLADVDDTRISAYAKLEFDDGEFYMNTFSVILGRDLAAARAALRRDNEEAKRQMEEEMMAAEPKTPVRIKREGSRYTKSVVSESGGILRDGDDSDSDERARRKERKSRKASKRSKSTGSSSIQKSRRNSLAMPAGRITYQPQALPRRVAPETSGAVPVDPASLRPSPYDCPLVPIHPPVTTPHSGYKAISRQHVKIAFNVKKHLFEAIIIGRNGAFVDDVFCYHNDTIPLKSGSKLQIGGVVVRFVLPDIAVGETGAERKPAAEDHVVADRYSEGGKEMSFDFEETPRLGAQTADTSEDASDREDNEQRAVAGGEQDEEEQEDDEDEDGEGYDHDEDADAEGEDEFESNHYGLTRSVEYEEDDAADEDARKLDPLLDATRPQKKRGPGRPPKNGIMSKREQQLAKKEALAREQAMKTVSQPSEPGQERREVREGEEVRLGKDGKPKNKVGRPRKHPRPDTPPIKTEKRKYTKRKPKDPADPNAKPEDGDEKKAKKEKPPKPPRSPSPTFNEADLTPEQLAKPQANYVTLIYEALSNSPAGQMSLPQIYRAIMRKYPFFVLKCNTNGWQSSVRHNLSQHDAFRKVERDGKGWMWAIVEGVPVEKEKKRRSPPPPAPHHYPQQIYSGPPPPGYMYPPGMMPPPGYPMHHMPPHYQHGQQPPPGYMAAPPHMNGYPPPPPSAQPPMNGQPPAGFTAPLPAQIGVVAAAASAPKGTYSSPYAPKPPPSAASPQHLNQQPSQQPQTQPQQSSHQQQTSQSQPQAQGQTQTQTSPQQGAVAPQTQQQQQLTGNQPPSQGSPSQPVPATAQGPNHNSTTNVQQQHLQQPTPPPMSIPAANTSPPQMSETVMRVINTFKENLVNALKETSDNAEAVVDSAVDRVLGVTSQSTVPGNPHEGPIMVALSNMLSQLPGTGIKPMQLPELSVQAQQQQNASQAENGSTHAPPQSSPRSTGAEKNGPVVARPSFAGQGQNRPSVPRPPMMTPGMKRTESASPAPPRPSTASSASPAPQSTVNGASTSVPNATAAPTETTQIAGQKRPLDDADDMREFKRLSTSGPPQVKT
ncbi:hypothetical protein BP6252_12275 [Coleophoma cylindrospora]|uniref:Fork-head domain-containing protein n=1 Tax=Coleophoma cylindrospora TaxID=1849047 RepID=A0A3D8QGE5_9HELO|nr:hypothetical protein BP6252_12275 [Coleophoma cylindrospora]